MKSTLKTMLLSTAVAATSLMGATAVVADGHGDDLTFHKRD